MVMETVAVIAVVIFAALAATTIQTQFKLRKTLAEADLVFGSLREEIPVLAANLNAMARSVDALSMEARRGIQQTSGFLGAVGEAGEQLKQIRQLVYGQGDAWRAQARGVWAGVRAVSSVLLNRIH